MYVNVKKVKAYMKSKGKRTSASFIETLNRKIEDILDKTARNAGSFKTVTDKEFLTLK